MPGEIKSAVKRANNDDSVKVIILAGKGRAFCAGYDLKMSVERERGEDNIGEFPSDDIAQPEKYPGII